MKEGVEHRKSTKANDNIPRDNKILRITSKEITKKLGIIKITKIVSTEILKNKGVFENGISGAFYKNIARKFSV